jgi:hypothetical protein
MGPFRQEAKIADRKKKKTKKNQKKQGEESQEQQIGRRAGVARTDGV